HTLAEGPADCFHAGKKTATGMRTVIMSQSILSRRLRKEEVRRQESEVRSNLMDKGRIRGKCQFLMNFLRLSRIDYLDPEFISSHKVLRGINIGAGIGLVDKSIAFVFCTAGNDLLSGHDGLDQFSVPVDSKIEKLRLELHVPFAVPMQHEERFHQF